MNAVEKILQFAESESVENAEDLATKIKRTGKRSGLKVVDSDESSVTISVDDETPLRVVRNGASGFGVFAAFMKRKRSVLLPKLDKIGGNDDWTVYETEDLAPLDEVVGEERAAEFHNWVNRYVDTRIEGENAWRSKDHRPPDMGDIVNYGNLRGLLNKLVAFARKTDSNFNTQACFKVRGKDQLVIADPIA